MFLDGGGKCPVPVLMNFYRCVLHYFINFDKNFLKIIKIIFVQKKIDFSTDRDSKYRKINNKNNTNSCSALANTGKNKKNNLQRYQIG